eukprot:scaffold12492_cov51-Attheya_sp.AAC.3
MTQDRKPSPVYVQLVLFIRNVLTGCFVVAIAETKSASKWLVLSSVRANPRWRQCAFWVVMIRHDGLAVYAVDEHLVPVAAGVVFAVAYRLTQTRGVHRHQLVFKITANYSTRAPPKDKSLTLRLLFSPRWFDWSCVRNISAVGRQRIEPRASSGNRSSLGHSPAIGGEDDISNVSNGELGITSTRELYRRVGSPDYAPLVYISTTTISYVI